MKSVCPRSLRLSAFLLVGPSLHAVAATIDISPSISLNNVPITRVQYDVGGMTVTQTSEATGVTNLGNTSVALKSVTGSGPAMTFFNVAQSKVVNVNPGLAGIAKIGVFNGGTVTSSTGGLTPYANAFAATSTDTNLRNYVFHDLEENPWPLNPAVADADLLFAKALNPGDFLVVSERWGNSSFQLLALAADGNPIVGANLLRLGGSATRVQAGYGIHDWNTGYASTDVPDQAQVLTLFSVAKFFETLGPQPQQGGQQLPQQAVYGLRIFNSDVADIKLLGISDNTFDDNPDNPQVIPEPSSLLVTLTSGLALAFVRRRRVVAR